MTTLSRKRLKKAYSQADHAAVHDLHRTVASGSLTALLGPSGSGKTTTMTLIAGPLAPNAGDVALDSQSTAAVPPEGRGIAMVFQSPLPFPHLTLAGNLGFGLRMRGTPVAEIANAVAAMLDRVRLSGLATVGPCSFPADSTSAPPLAAP